MDLLPSEVLLKIFRNLSYKDLNSVLLVSRRFKYLAEDPLLWRNFHLQITSKLCNQLDDCLLQIRRLANVSHILVWGYGLNRNQIETVFNSLRKKRSISHVRFTSIDLSNIDEDILSSYLASLTAVILDLNYLTLAQTKAIFEKLRGGSWLKHLDISYNALLSVPESALQASLQTLQTLRLLQVQISARQVEAVMEGLTGGHSLQALELHGLSLDSLQPELFGEALCNVKSVVLHNTFGYNVTPAQLQSLFSRAVGNNKTKLRSFHLLLGDLSDLDLPLLASFILSEIQVRFTDCTLSEPQYQYFSQRGRINITHNFGSIESSVHLDNYMK